MKTSFSNIAWAHQDDSKILPALKDLGFNGIEIAPTIIIENPYTNTTAIQEYVSTINDKYGFVIPSMQSIWYGKTENIFNPNESDILIAYTKKIIDLASLIGCRNLVFGCPKNRVMPEDASPESVIPFFKTLGDYAKSKNTILSLEPNPKIYDTNFINTTTDAFLFVKEVGSEGLKVNVDLGTMIQNQEDISILRDNFKLINHIHISEPNLIPIQKRAIHTELAQLLKECGFMHFVSVEMKNPSDNDIIIETAKYISEIFN